MPRRQSQQGNWKTVRYLWVPGTIAATSLAAASTSLFTDLLTVYGSDIGSDPVPGIVIERIIGSFWYRSESNTGLDVGLTAALRVMTEEAAAGAVSPILRSEIARYLWWTGAQATGTTEVSAGVFQPLWQSMHFDVKGRWRLVNVGDELRLLCTNEDAESAITVALFLRTLLRIP